VSFPAPTRADHQKFCEREGWTQVRTARGRTGTHHITFELTLPDGRVLRTRISHPPDRSTYGRALWGHILRDQLDVTEDVFWACVRDEVVPARAATTQPGSGIPAALVHQLLTHGVPESEVAGMTRADALRRLNELWSGE
jgi:hypothetical protein